MRRLLTVWLVVLFSSVGEQEADSLTITIAPPEIEMGGSFRSCVEGLGPGMSMDVWYLRPNFHYAEVQFDWQKNRCETHKLDTGWNKDVGVWEIVAIRPHREGDYHSAWRNTSVKLNVLPNAKLRPEFEWLAQRKAEANAAARKLLLGGVLYIVLFGLVPAMVVQRLIHKNRV